MQAVYDAAQIIWKAQCPISRRRGELGMNQLELAVASGISMATVKSLETGRRFSRRLTLETLAPALKVRSDYLIVVHRNWYRSRPTDATALEYLETWSK